MRVNELLRSPPAVINVGLEGFAEDLAAEGVPVVQVDWSPPAGGDERLGGLLAALDSLDLVERANAETLERIFRAEPVLIDVRPAGEAIPGLADRMVLHAGPPIGWDTMCGPLRGAIAGAAVLEGWAADLEQAAALAASGALAFRPNHDFSAVGPMTGLITRSMPVMVVENRAFGNRAYSTLNEGLGKVMRFGGNDGEVLARLRWIAEILGPALAAALRQSGGLALKGIVARGLSMGDEMHQRNVGCTGLFLREIAPALARAVDGRERLASILAFIGGNDQFFLNLAMVMGKAIMDPARGVAGSSIVTAMSRNGTDFGIRVGGTGDTWFTAPVEMPRGLYFPGFSAGRRQPRHGRFDDRRDRRAGRLRHGRRTGCGRLRRGRYGGGRAGIHARHVRDYRRAQPELDPAGARLRGRPHGNRRPKGGGDCKSACNVDPLSRGIGVQF